MIKKLFFKVKIVFPAILLVVFVFSSTGCKKQSRKAEAKSIVKEWIGKEIKFPDDFQCNLSGKDTSYMLCADLLESEFKILSYVDSTGCTDCKLQLIEWDYLINELNYVQGDKLSFLFFLHPKDITELQLLIQRNNFQHPVFIDTKNEINLMNKFAKQSKYHCFLLDKNNKILVIGNPVQSIEILELYKQQIGLSDAN
ncbi:MAG: hypothetical protein ACOCWM_01220 [Cyclobacteriaceae bacterium]